MESQFDIEAINYFDEIKAVNDSGNKRQSETHEIKQTFRSNDIYNKTAKAIPKTKAYLALKQCIDFIESFGIVLGWNTNNEWKSNPRHWLIVSYLAFTWSQFFYSQFKYFMNCEYKRIFEVFAVYGIAISCSLKIRCFIRYFKEMTAVHNFSFKLCRQSSGKMADKLEIQQIQYLKLFKLTLFLGIISASIYIYHPIKSFLDNRELVSLVPIEIMFTDQNRLSGFLIANVLMVLMGFYAVLATLYIGLHFIAHILNYSMQVDIIEADIRQLDEFWHDTTTTSVSERYLFLRNICQKCQDKDNYISEVKKIFDETIYLYFCFAYISQILSLYIIKAEDWKSGYGIAYGLFVEMMFYCFIGTRATIINERLCYIITQSNWYTYDIYSQKEILLLLSSCMNAKELWIGPLAPLSVFTDTEIIKSIYSYYTLLAEVM